MKTDKILLFLITVFLITLISLIISCTHKADFSGVPQMCFERDVFPIFLNTCANKNCHDGSGESELLLNSYTDILRGVVPGYPYSSSIYQSIIKKTGENKMPPLMPLTLENRVKIRIWIEQGAVQSTCPQ